jgi:hypothetical protein
MQSACLVEPGPEYAARRSYRLKAGLILTTSDPKTNPLFAPFSRTSAAAVHQAGHGWQGRLSTVTVQANIFADREDSRTFGNVQHFGIQNKLDPQLHERIQMDSFTRKPGRLDPPAHRESA